VVINFLARQGQLCNMTLPACCDTIPAPVKQMSVSTNDADTCSATWPLCTLPLWQAHKDACMLTCINMFYALLSCDGTCWNSIPFHHADKFCENHLKACGLSASIKHAYQHLFASKKTLILWKHYTHCTTMPTKADNLSSGDTTIL